MGESGRATRICGVYALGKLERLYLMVCNNHHAQYSRLVQRREVEGKVTYMSFPCIE